MQAARHLSKGRPFITTLLVGSNTSVLQPQRRKYFPALQTVGKETWPTIRTNNVTRHQSTASAGIVDADAHQSNMLKVRWGDGGENVYPNIWLRDNCQCSTCFHASSLSRQVMLHHLSLSIDCADVKVSNGGEELQVQWTDGHQGIYGSKWLKERAFRTSKHEQGSQHSRFSYALPKKYWGHELEKNLPSASFSDLLQSDKALHAFLETLEELGIVMVCGVPLQLGQVQRLTERIGRMKLTHYGETFFVENKIDTNNLAYTASSLDLHTDQPYLLHSPGIQLLHVVKQFPGDGGDSLLVDGFRVAEQLRESNPEHFKILTETLVDYYDVGVDRGSKFDSRQRRPIIGLGADGSVKNIAMNQMVRDSYFDVSPDTALSWYAAIIAFRDLLYKESNNICYKMKAGDMAVFDNERVLHGRKGYRAEEGERLLEGCYWEWDAVMSRRTVLRKELTA